MTQIVEQTTALPPIPPIQDANSRKFEKADYYNGTNADKLVLSGRVIYNLTYDQFTRELMLPFGYTPNKIEQFSLIQRIAADACNDQQIEYAEKTIAYRTFEQKFKSAKSELSSLINVARVALKSDPLLAEKIDLYAKKGDTISKTLNYMQNFYNNIFGIAGITEKLSAYGYDDARLRLCLSTFTNANNDYNQYKLESADAHDSTKVRDQRMAELNDWMYDYYALYKVAYLQHNPLIHNPQISQQ